ncbi:MAG: AraC family transcriptional regulator [Clostridiales bacterium]|nr:AraC family transcriptional regulator [Clostridiales bacterium]
MQKELLDKLRVITNEEAKILEGNKTIEKEIYTAHNEFVIDGRKMLDRGKLIDIRPHTRFAHFPKHRHNYIEIVYMCSGQTTHIINDSSKVVLKAGDVLFLNQNAYQEIMPAEINDIAVNFIILPEFFDFVFSMLDEENILRNFIIGNLRHDSGRIDYLHYKVADVLPVQNLIENLVWSILNKQVNKRHTTQVTMGLLFLQLLNYTEKLDSTSPKQHEQNQVLNILQSIEENYQNISLTDIAKSTNQSVYQLSRLIKENTGSTFKDLVQKKRLNQAAYLLTNTNLTVDDIIYRVGYENTSYFYRIFKRRYKMTPSEFRKKQKI